MSEGAEGQQPQQSQVEQVTTPAHNQEAGQKQNVEARPEKPSPWVDSVKQQLQWQREENDKWLKENAENPEMAKEWGELWKNAETLRDNLGKFSEDDPNIPASPETKQKLRKLEPKNSDEPWDNMNIHEKAFVFFGSLGLGAAAGEGLNYMLGIGAPPGMIAKIGLVTATALSGSMEAYALANIGIEKLRALTGKNKGGEEQRPPVQKRAA